MLRGIFAAGLGLSLGVFYSGTGVHAQTTAQAGPQTGTKTTSSTSDGVYTAAQAQQNNPAYQKECASCHGADLEGNGPTPPLVGDDFIKNWQGMTLGDLFDKIQTQMPADHPGTLTREQTAGILAYIMSVNKYPAGKTELPSDAGALKQIRIDNPPSASAKN